MLPAISAPRAFGNWGLAVDDDMKALLFLGEPPVRHVVYDYHRNKYLSCHPNCPYMVFRADGFSPAHCALHGKLELIEGYYTFMKALCDG
jgi:hypothetical protein